MRLFLHNIGKLKEASVDMEGITVIAGENNTGKSTVGKALFLYLHSFIDVDEYVRNDAAETMQREMRQPMETFDLLCRKLSNAQRRHKVSRAGEIRREYAAKITNNDFENLDQTLDALAADHADLYGLGLKNFRKVQPDYDAWKQKLKDKVNNLLEISESTIAARKVTNDVERYFNGDIITIGTREGEIRAEYEEGRKKNTLQFERDSKGAKDFCVSIGQEENVSASPVYIESPKTVDQLYRVTKGRNGVSGYFSEILSPNALGVTIDLPESANTDTVATATQQVQAAELLKKFKENIEETVGGSLQFNIVNGLQFQEKGRSRMVDVSNLSNGIKALTLLEYAIECGCLGTGDCLILDEPEINLHPAWQLKYAEQIVYLQKLLGLSIVLTTHTPYFLEAVELYSRRYKIEKNCHYYMTEVQNDEVRLIEVTENTEPIYKKLARPFEELDDLREVLEQRR